jgi:hypothetical protein
MVGAELWRKGGGIRLAASVGKGGGGGFLVGCDGTGLRANECGAEEPVAAMGLLPGGGGVSRRVPANKSKSSKSRMTALGAEQEGSGASGGDVERGVSCSKVAGLLVVLVGAAMPQVTLVSAGGVETTVSGLFELDECGGSALDRPTRSSCLLHRSSRYTARHFSSMMATVRSTLNVFFAVPGRADVFPLSLPFPRATTSFTVRQPMHRNVVMVAGTLTRESQHMHLRAVFPSSSSPAPSGCFFL